MLLLVNGANDTIYKIETMRWWVHTVMENNSCIHVNTQLYNHEAHINHSDKASSHGLVSGGRHVSKEWIDCSRIQQASDGA